MSNDRPCGAFLAACPSVYHHYMYSIYVIFWTNKGACLLAWFIIAVRGRGAGLSEALGDLKQ